MTAKEIRVSMGLSRAQMAKRMKRSVTTVSTLENHGAPNLAAALRAMRFYKCSLEPFMVRRKSRAGRVRTQTTKQTQSV